ncbi:MAG TPA: DinB family protein [Armatimonadota bacterium]
MDPKEQAAKHAESARDRLITAITHVPDDKLGYTPSPTAKSALGIAAHAANSNGYLARMMRGEPMPNVPREELMEMAAKADAALATRDQVIARLKESTEEVVSAIKSLTPEQLQGDVAGIFGTRPTKDFIGVPGFHMDGHTAQINYLQTVWGDMEFRM